MMLLAKPATSEMDVAAKLINELLRRFGTNALMAIYPEGLRITLC